jgi:predicted anti-sigma-YlaC factor YlaD
MSETHPHLDPEELDLWLEERLPSARTSHLETCEECRSLAEETREMVRELHRLRGVQPTQGFADRVMARIIVAPAGDHLSAEDLDAWVIGALAAPRESHLRACPECRALADQERLLVLRLEALPLFSPAPAFADHVLDRLEQPPMSLAGAWRRWRGRVSREPASAALAAGVAVLLGGSIAASAAWASTNQELILGTAGWLAAEGQHLALQGAENIVATLAAQHWYQAVRTGITPLRLTLLASAMLGLYAYGMVALRRLLTPPPSPSARALP